MTSLPAHFSGLCVTIRDLESGAKETFDRAKISFPDDGKGASMVLSSFRGKIIDEFLLIDCVYLEESSIAEQIECFDVCSRKLRVIIRDRDKNQQEEMIDLCTRLKATKQPSRIHDQSQIDQLKKRLIKKINQGGIDRANHYAYQLAEGKVELVLSLDASKCAHTENQSTTQPIKIFRVKICLESLTGEVQNGQVFEVSIAEHTTIDQLKDMIERLVKIERERQFWFIDRACLADSYAFDGKSSPLINETTVVSLLIVPQISS